MIKVRDIFIKKYSCYIVKLTRVEWYGINTKRNTFKMIRVVGNNEPIELYYTPEMYDEAVKKATEMGRLYQSFTQGKSTWAGMLGEAIVETWVDGIITNDFQYDILTKGRTKLEVKTKKTTLLTAPPNHYECSVCEYNYKQNCDAYVFLRVCTLYQKSKDPAHAKAWICGWKRKDVFKEEAIYFKKGEYDERNHYTVHANCYNMAIGDLDRLPSFEEKNI